MPIEKTNEYPKNIQVSPLSCYMAMPSLRPPQKSMRMGGGALKRHQKQNRKKLRKSTRNSVQKVIQNDMALSSVQVRVINELYNLRYADKKIQLTVSYPGRQKASKLFDDHAW